MNAPRRQRTGAAEISAALDAGEPLRLVLVRTGDLGAAAREVLERCERARIAVRTASAREILRMAAHGEPELLGLVGPDPSAGLDGVLAASRKARGVLWLIAGVAYPGNAGFAIRTAEVSGASGIAIDAAFGHAGRRQALRTAMRADRFFPVVWERADVTLDCARAAGHRVIGIEDRGRAAPWEVDLTGAVVLAVGGEARGIPAPLLDACDAVLRIPMRGFIPSYNLQAAVAIVAGERLRQELGRDSQLASAIPVPTEAVQSAIPKS